MGLQNCRTKKKEEIINYEKELYKSSQQEANNLSKLYRVIDDLKKEYYKKEDQRENTWLKKKYLKQLIDKYQEMIDQYNYLNKEKRKMVDHKLDKIFNEDLNYKQYIMKLYSNRNIYMKKAKNAESLIDKKAYNAMSKIYEKLLR